LVVALGAQRQQQRQQPPQREGMHLDSPPQLSQRQQQRHQPHPQLQPPQ
jgi:hypothetical protein